MQFQNNQNTMIFAVQNTWNTDVLSTEGRSSRVLPLCKTSCDSCSLRQCRPKILKLTAAQVPRGRTASDRIKLKGVAGLSVLQGIAIFVLSISHVGSSWGLYKDDLQWSSCDWNRGIFFLRRRAMLCWILLILPLSFLAEWKGTPSIWTNYIANFLAGRLARKRELREAVFCGLQSWYVTTKNVFKTQRSCSSIED